MLLPNNLVHTAVTDLLPTHGGQVLALHLQASPQLEGVLQSALSSTEVTKVGLELSADLKKLARSYPTNAAFRTANSCIDLKQLWSLYRASVPAAQQAHRSEKKRQVGLSFLTEHLLGKPLDKAMQVRCLQ